MLTKEPEMDATRCVLQAYNAAKCDCGRKYTPQKERGRREEIDSDVQLEQGTGPLTD